MLYYDYSTKKIVDYNEKNKALELLYNNVLGRLLLKAITTKPVSNMSRIYMNTFLSKPMINKTILGNNIKMDDFENKEYLSFNDFFVRKIKDGKRPIDNGIVAPCDSKLLVYDINDDLTLHIKNSIYTVDELIKDDSDNFKGGKALVFRLTVSDYHHYIFPFDGEIISSKEINGRLHTVQPIAEKRYKVFAENNRIVSLLKTKKYGNVAFIEVGALFVGRIVNENVDKFKKGDEKGHFEYGGSTIILLFEKDKININEEILEQSRNNIETIIKLGTSLE